MLDVAYLFPGQGAQYVGMGLDFYNQYSEAKEIFERANDTLGFELTKLIFNGPAEELTKTGNCQVAIFTMSIACLAGLKAQNLNLNVKYTAGLSLGEYAALVASNVLSFEEGLKLVQKRGRYMDEAGQQNPGGMVSVVGLNQDVVEKICQDSGSEIANLNCPGQIVVSGSFSALDKLRELAAAEGVRKTIPLQVGGAFHSSLMRHAADALSADLEKVKISEGKIPVVSNVTAKEETKEQIRHNLAQQVAHRTRWEDSIRLISARGIRDFLEIGPGKVIKGLLRKIDPKLSVYNIGTVEDLEKFNTFR